MTGRSMHIVVDFYICNGCGLCAEECPANVFSIIDGKARPINEEECILCGHCLDICSSAISWIPINDNET